MKRELGFLRESASIVALAGLCAAVSNGFARRERHLAWLGTPPSIPGVEAPPSAPPSSFRPTSPGPSGAEPAVPALAGVGEFAPHPERPFVEITPLQARTLFDRGALFVDARRTEAYREGHVRGARSISVWESDADDRVKALLDEGRDPKAPIVAYCSGGDCEDSHQLAQKLWGVTFDNVYVYRDGFPDWQKRGWPVSSGEAR